MKTVELFPAFAWVCDECGIRQYASGITLAQEEVDELIDPIDQLEVVGVEGVWMRSPTTVCCNACHAEFKTTEFGE